MQGPAYETDTFEVIIFINDPNTKYLAEKAQVGGHRADQPDQDARRQ